MELQLWAQQTDRHTIKANEHVTNVYHKTVSQQKNTMFYNKTFTKCIKENRNFMDQWKTILKNED